MGNRENKHERGQGHGLQRKKKTEISPYREGIFRKKPKIFNFKFLLGLSAYTQSPLVKFIKSSNQFNLIESTGGEENSN